MPVELPVWELTILSEHLGELEDEPKEEVPCELTVQGVEYEDCEVRYRGATSLYYPKKSFRIRFPEDAPHPGFSRKINLRAEYNDPTFMRNHLSYEVFRQLTAIATPRSRYVRLRLNGEYQGLYLDVERIGGKFLRVRGRDREEPLYEADPASESYLLGGASFIPLPDDVHYGEAYDKKTDEESGHEELHMLLQATVWYDYLDSVDAPSNSTRRIRTEVNWDLLVDYLAVMALIQNHEHVKKNYYFSRQSFGQSEPRWEFYPWDLDLTFGCLFDSEGQSTMCTELTHTGAMDRGVIPSGLTDGYPDPAFFNLLIHLVMRDPEMRSLFDARVCELTASDFWRKGVATYALSLQSALAQAVAEDPNDLNEDLSGFEEATDALRDFIPARTEYLRQTLGCDEASTD